MAKQYMHNHISIVPKVMIPGIEWAVQLPTPLDAEAFRTVAQVLVQKGSNVDTDAPLVVIA